MHLKALFYFIFACNGPHGLAIIKKHLKNLPAFFSNINVRDVMLQQHSCKLDIQYIDIVLGLRFWVLQEGVFGFLKKTIGERGEGGCLFF